MVRVNGKTVAVKQKPGSYISISRKWKNGDKIVVNYPMGLHEIPNNDNPNQVAFAYGPIVLAGQMGKDNFSGTEPFSNPKLYNDYYTYDYHVPANLVKSLKVDRSNISRSIKPLDNHSISFKTNIEGIVLRPLYDTHHERYVIYWDLNK